MRIGKQDSNFTSIATSDAETITVRGKDLCGELIGKIGFTDYFFFLVTGKMPTDVQRFFTDAVMVAIAEHGLVPSVQAARMTLAAAPEAVQGAIAAGILGMGSVVAGSSETSGRYIAGLLEKARASGKSFEDVAFEGLSELKARRQKAPGIGHPQHSAGDPRADVLIALADEKGVSGDHVAMLRAMAKVSREAMGRDLPINVSGAIPAVMLDVGYPLGAMMGLPVLARTASLVAHLFEEAVRPIGFIMSNHADMAIEYDGPLPAGAERKGGKHG
ncbi:MAG: citryl-CoA lyase [Rhizobiaceae bacterium]|nr:citryl-CoA lyase [Rhizobiaceae bacterium]